MIPVQVKNLSVFACRMQINFAATPTAECNPLLVSHLHNHSNLMTGLQAIAQKKHVAEHASEPISRFRVAVFTAGYRLDFSSLTATMNFDNESCQ